MSSVQLRKRESRPSKRLLKNTSSTKRESSVEAVQQKASKRPRRASSTKHPIWKRPAQRKSTVKEESETKIQQGEQVDKRLDHTAAQTEEQKAAESLLCHIYAEVEAAYNDESLQLRSEDLRHFMLAARVGTLYDDERAAPANRTKDRIRDRLIAVEDAGYEHPAFAAVSSVLAEIQGTHRAALRRNLVEFADRFDWMLLAICAQSGHFRDFIMDDNIKASLRDAFDGLLDRNVGSLKLFACSRGLGWKRLLSHHDKLFTKVEMLLSSPNGGIVIHTAEELAYLRHQEDRRTNPEKTVELPASYRDRAVKHPHELALAADNSVTVTVLQPEDNSVNARPVLEKRNISESRVPPGEEYQEQRQDEWPIPDPRWRSSKEAPCHVCGNKLRDDTKVTWHSSICQCTLRDLKDHLRAHERPLFVADRVELVKAERFGVGVRALQRFGPGSLLAEAVGEIYLPEDSPEYDEYVDSGRYTTGQLSVEKWKTHRQKNHRGLRFDDTNALCQIDAAVFGNWTRYLNHSCNANTRLQQFSEGDKVLMCFRVEDGKNVSFGDILTMNYGKHYFIGKNIACQCGEDCCQLWNDKRIGNNRKTLAESRRDGTVPDWA